VEPPVLPPVGVVPLEPLPEVPDEPDPDDELLLPDDEPLPLDPPEPLPELASSGCRNGAGKNRPFRYNHLVAQLNSGVTRVGRVVVNANRGLWCPADTHDRCAGM